MTTITNIIATIAGGYEGAYEEIHREVGALLEC